MTTTNNPAFSRPVPVCRQDSRGRTSLRAIFLAGLAACALGAAAMALPQSHHKPSPNDCLLYATVFTADGHILPGADAQAHLVGKKKPTWEATSDARGEFAIRVPPDGDYEIEVKAKGFVMQTHTVTAEMGERLDLVFNMPYEPKKK